MINKLLRKISKLFEEDVDFVWVERDKTVRELTDDEKNLVAAPILTADDCVGFKQDYDSFDEITEFSGFLLRKELPENICVNPVDDVN